MALGKYDSRAATVLCPIPDCYVRIFKDRAAYAAHLVSAHSATDTAFLDKGVRGKNQYDRSDALDDGAPVVFREEEALVRCGCGSTFFSTSSLVSHLIVSHGFPEP